MFGVESSWHRKWDIVLFLTNQLVDDFNQFIKSNLHQQQTYYYDCMKSRGQPHPKYKRASYIAVWERNFKMTGDELHDGAGAPRAPPPHPDPPLFWPGYDVGSTYLAYLVPRQTA